MRAIEACNFVSDPEQNKPAVLYHNAVVDVFAVEGVIREFVSMCIHDDGFVINDTERDDCVALATRFVSWLQTALTQRVDSASYATATGCVFKVRENPTSITTQRFCRVVARRCRCSRSRPRLSRPSSIAKYSRSATS